MYELPGYLWAIALFGVIGIVSSACLVLARGAVRAGLGRARAALLGATAAVLLGGWCAASGLIAARGTYHTRLGHQPPWLPIAVAGVLIALLAALRIPLLARALSVPGTLSRLTLLHTFRVAGVVFVITMALGRLPALFALPAGLGDIATGVAAPFVARRLARGVGRRGAVWFNVMGLADLVTALTLGGLTAFQLVNVSPSPEANLRLPLVLIPTAVVPLLIAVHITSLRQLANTTATRLSTSSAAGLAG